MAYSVAGPTKADDDSEEEEESEEDDDDDEDYDESEEDIPEPGDDMYISISALKGQQEVDLTITVSFMIKDNSTLVVSRLFFWTIFSLQC